MSLAKEITSRHGKLINAVVASHKKVWCLLLPTSFEQTIKEARRWLTNLEVDDWGLGRWIYIFI